MRMFSFVWTLAVFSFCCSALSTERKVSIVFIHIGKSIPAYAQTAVSQARLFNPHASIFMLANEAAFSSFDCTDVKCVALESLRHTQPHADFLARTNLDSQSREGFWLYASERFLYLADFMSQHELRDVFHMEYDNMLYADLEELLPVFHRYHGIAATFDNDFRCIPGFVYIKDSTAMNRLAQYFSDHASESLNDMEVMARFRNSQGVVLCDIPIGQGLVHKVIAEDLPIITTEYINAYELVSTSGQVVANPQRFAENIGEFQSIFDAAALGQFLGGIDPRNGPSAPGFINESCIFNPSRLNIEWHTDAHGRRIPYVVYPHAKYRINNLHIHSKHLDLFKSK